MKEPKLVYIEWTDAHSSDRWQTYFDAKLNMSEMMDCKTVGYQISRTKSFVVIAHTTSWGDSETCAPLLCGLLHIPIKCVKLIKEVKL
jgi:5-methylcytosine-specific restriction endonuclease McrBC GTP-binding regulatory subunit McrB